MELENRINNWEYWCYSCKNRTAGIHIETPRPLKVGETKDGVNKMLIVRVLVCTRCQAPTVLGTHRFDTAVHVAHIPGIAPLATRSKEAVAFQLPGRERDLPKGISKEIVESFREAEKAVDRSMPIGAAAAIRNTIRLVVKENGGEDDDLKTGIEGLKLKDDFKRALGNLKLVGDHTLHYEKYSDKELRNALEVLHLSLEEFYAARLRLADLEKAVGDKASQKGLEKAAS